METVWYQVYYPGPEVYCLTVPFTDGPQRRSRIGSHRRKKDRNRKGRRYYRNGRYW